MGVIKVQATEVIKDPAMEVIVVQATEVIKDPAMEVIAVPAMEVIEAQATEVIKDPGMVQMVDLNGDPKWQPKGKRKVAAKKGHGMRMARQVKANRKNLGTRI